MNIISNNGKTNTSNTKIALGTGGHPRSPIGLTTQSAAATSAFRRANKNNKSQNENKSSKNPLEELEKAKDFSKLVPVKRADKNGHIVTRYINPVEHLKAEMFGTDSEIKEMAQIDRIPAGREGAFRILRNLIGKLLKSKSGIVATLSGNSIDEILSGRALNKSFDKKAHLYAAANIDKLFANAIMPWESGIRFDKQNENLKAVHRLYSPMNFNDKIIAVKFTVKEMKNEKEGKRLYSIEALNVDFNIEVDDTDRGRRVPQKSLRTSSKWPAVSSTSDDNSPQNENKSSKNPLEELEKALGHIPECFDKDLVLYYMRKAEWIEGKHPRDKSGKFITVKNLKDNIHTILHGNPEEKSALHNKHFYLANTPQFMKELKHNEQFVLSGNYFTVSYGVIARHRNKDDDHNLTEQNWLDLCDAIKTPFAITKHGSRVNMFTEIRINKHYIVVGVEMKNAGKELEVNSIRTAFGFKDRIIKDDIIYKSKKITLEQSALLDKPNALSLPPAQGLDIKIHRTQNMSSKNSLEELEKALETIPECFDKDLVLYYMRKADEMLFGFSFKDYTNIHQIAEKYNKRELKIYT